MRNLISLWALVIVLYKVIFCGADILSKFHQHGFKVKDIRFELISYDENYLNFLKVKSFKYNRTTTATNTTINAKVNLEDKLEVVVECYKLLSNEYRPMAVHFQVNAKKVFDTNALGLKAEMKKCKNMINFVIYKDITHHLLCNFVIDETHLPPLIPNGRYKIELQYIYLNHAVATVNLFLEVYTPIIYP